MHPKIVRYVFLFWRSAAPALGPTETDLLVGWRADKSNTLGLPKICWCISARFLPFQYVLNARPSFSIANMYCLRYLTRSHKVTQGLAWLARSHKVTQGRTRWRDALQGPTFHSDMQSIMYFCVFLQRSYKVREASQGLAKSHNVPQLSGDPRGVCGDCFESCWDAKYPENDCFQTVLRLFAHP